MTNPEYVLAINDVYNVIAEHLVALDELWPDSGKWSDSDPDRPRKVHVVELIDGIKLKLVKQAEKNLSRYQSPFERAAERVMGKKHDGDLRAASEVVKGVMAPPATQKTSMQIALEESRARIKKNNPP